SAAAGQRFLVRHDVRLRGIPGRQQAQSLCHWRPRSIEVQRRRIARYLHAERFSRPGQGVELVTDPGTGSVGITMRLYAPKAQVLQGRWFPPAVQVLNQ